MNFLSKLFSKDSKPNSESQMQNSAQSTNDKTTKIRKIRKSSTNQNIITPNQNELQSYLNKWDTMENYRNQEHALNKLFHRTYPHNNDLDEVLVKVATLNDFYSTNIFNIFAVAKHILSIPRIDSRIQSGDESLVGAIAQITINGKAQSISTHLRLNSAPTTTTKTLRFMIAMWKKCFGISKRAIDSATLCEMICAIMPHSKRHSMIFAHFTPYNAT